MSIIVSRRSFPNDRRAANWRRKGGNTNNMKYLALLALAAMALSLGACSHHEDTSHTATHSTSTGYSK